LLHGSAGGDSFLNLQSSKIVFVSTIVHIKVVFGEGIDPQASAYLLFGSMQGLMLLSKSLKKVDPLDQGFWQALKLLKNE